MDSSPPRAERVHKSGGWTQLAGLLASLQVILFPVAKPTAMLLDLWLGSEAITYFRERDFRALIARHVKAAVPEMGAVEGRGAVNFPELDDIPIAFEGEPLDPASVIPRSSGASLARNRQETGIAPYIRDLSRE